MGRVSNGRTWTRRQSLSLMGGAIGGLALHACTQPTGTSPTASPTSIYTPKTLSAAMGLVVWTGNAPLYIAQAKGFFQALGLTLNTKIFNSNPDGSAAFATGRVDGWTAVISEATLLAARGKDYRVVLVQDSSVGADGILARNSIADLQDFKGKRIAVEEGGVSHFFLLEALQQVGLSDRDITIVNVSPDAAAAAYQAGKTEIAVTYSPFLEQANAAQKDGRIIYDSTKLPTTITDLYLFDTQFINANSEAIQAFVQGSLQGLEFLQNNPQEGLAIAAKNLGVSPEELAINLKGLKLPDQKANLEILNNPQSDLYLLKSMEAMAKFLVSQKKIAQVPDLSKLLEPKFLINLPQPKAQSGELRSEKRNLTTVQSNQS